MKRITFFVYGTFCHVLFLATFAYLAAFVGNLGPVQTIDAAGASFSWVAATINLTLIALFGIQHSVMARPGFKRWWTRFIPQEIERSTYVLASCIVLIAFIGLWQPMGPTIWNVENPAGRAALWTLFAAGWLMVPVVSLLINHFDLFGTRQVWLQLKGRPYTQLPFGTPGIYRFIRHPLYVAWMVAFWATPTMTMGHLIFALGMTGYMIAAIPVEERDLIDLHGEKYRSYRERVPALVPIARTRPAGASATRGGSL